MSNDSTIRDFMEFYAGDYPVRSEKLRTYAARLSSVDGEQLRAALGGLMADPKVSRLPSLADIVHKLPRGTGGGSGPIAENLDCPRACHRGEVVLLGRDGYDFLAPCDCSAGQEASRSKHLRMVSVHNGLDVGYAVRERAPDVVDLASDGIGPADVPPPITDEQRRWMDEHEGGPVVAAYEMIAARARRAGKTIQVPPPKIDDERTPGQRRAARRDRADA